MTPEPVDGPFGHPAAIRRPDEVGKDLGGRVDIELRRRLDEAVDFASLDAMVKLRRTRNLPAPVADNADDRAEFTALVRDFLEHLHRELSPAASEGPRRPVDGSGAPGDRLERLVTVQVAFAKALPDYWQRFEAVRVAYVAEYVASGGKRRSLVARLLGRG